MLIEFQESLKYVSSAKNVRLAEERLLSPDLLALGPKLHTWGVIFLREP